MIEVDIEVRQEDKILEGVVSYYATIPSEDEEQDIINEVLHNQTVGLIHQSLRMINENSRDTLTHGNVQHHNQQTLPHYNLA